jgi:membrane carboxypeptidase/penicillin-binding protein
MSRAFKTIATVIVVLLFLPFAAFLGLWLWIAAQLPAVERIVQKQLPACPSIEARVIPTKLAELPSLIPEVFVAAEQPNFWNARTTASYRFLSGVFVSLFSDGDKPDFIGYTFSTSLASESISDAFPNERSVSQHVRQLVQVDRIEFSLSKTRILELALDHSYFGNGIYGLSCASNFYFEKPPKNLNLSEMALLAALLRSPSKYDPIKHPASAIERRNMIIQRLSEKGLVSLVQAKEAQLSQLLLAIQK